MDLSKAFEYAPHDLLLAKLAAYGVDEIFLCDIYSYLLNRKQCVPINNVNTKFLNVVLGVPQGSIVGSILFNCSFNDFFTLLNLLVATILQTIIHKLPLQITFKI